MSRKKLKPAERRNVQLHGYCNGELLKKLDAYAKREGLTRSEAVVKAVEELVA